MRLKSIPGSILAPKGFLAAGVFCDIKRLGTGKGSEKGQKRDLGLIVSEVPAVVAGMFTINQVCAAPVRLCIERVRGGEAQAIVANSGNANACTGTRGMKDAVATAKCAAALLHMPVEHLLVASTGRIGVKMPMANVFSGIRHAAALLGNAPEHASEVAEAIMTSDTVRKEAAVEFTLGRQVVRIGGICKGAGMIQPGMSANGRRPAAVPAPAAPHATMLCFLTTDAAIGRAPLQKALKEATARSFNRITVDGDMSTNDTVLILANGCAGNPRITEGKANPHLAAFQEALNHVTLELAKTIVRDGEGVSRFVTVRVHGARTTAEADAAARAVANSSLVKTSWHGGDPNWGRIIDALGYSKAGVIEERIDIGYSAPGARRILYALKHGQPARVSFRSLCVAVAAREFDVHINLNLGKADAAIFAADLTEQYVDFNKGNVDDPASLGG